MKILMWLALFGLVIAALYSKISSVRSRIPRPQQSGQFDNNGAETMLRCSYCEVYIPSSEAISHAGAVYCCEDHRGKPALS